MAVILSQPQCVNFKVIVLISPACLCFQHWLRGFSSQDIQLTTPLVKPDRKAPAEGFNKLSTLSIFQAIIKTGLTLPMYQSPISTMALYISVQMTWPEEICHTRVVDSFTWVHLNIKDSILPISINKITHNTVMRLSFLCNRIPIFVGGHLYNETLEISWLSYLYNEIFYWCQDIFIMKQDAGYWQMVKQNPSLTGEFQFVNLFLFLNPLRPRDTSMCLCELDHHWFTWPAPSQNLNQYWDIYNWTLRNKLQWNLKWNSYIFNQKNKFENVIWIMAVMLSQPQCANFTVIELISPACLCVHHWLRGFSSQDIQLTTPLVKPDRKAQAEGFNKLSTLSIFQAIIETGLIYLSMEYFNNGIEYHSEEGCLYK